MSTRLWSRSDARATRTAAGPPTYPSARSAESDARAPRVEGPPTYPCAPGLSRPPAPLARTTEAVISPCVSSGTHERPASSAGPPTYPGNPDSSGPSPRWARNLKPWLSTCLRSRSDARATRTAAGPPAYPSARSAESDARAPRVERWPAYVSRHAWLIRPPAPLALALPTSRLLAALVAVNPSSLPWATAQATFFATGRSSAKTVDFPPQAL